MMDIENLIINDELINVFEETLNALSVERTKDELGDRGGYIGASDIGGCMRKTVLTKLYPETTHSLDSLLHFERGHMSEDIFAKVFDKMGLSYTRQVEVNLDNGFLLEGDLGYVPVSGHIDFTFIDHHNKKIFVKEIKAPGLKIPSQPYDDYENQLQFQMGLLSQKYPNYKISGAICMVSLGSCQIETFGPYYPDFDTFQKLIYKAKKMWQLILDARAGKKIEPWTATGPLCSFCSHLQGCPKYQGKTLNFLDSFVEKLIENGKKIKELEADIDDSKKYLFTVQQQIGDFIAGGKYFKERQNKRTSLDKNKITSFILDNDGCLEDFQKQSCSFTLGMVKVKEEKTKKSLKKAA